MKTMNVKSALLLVVAALLLTTIQSSAQRGQGRAGMYGQMNRGDMARGAMMLPDLTEEQEEAIQSLRLAFADATLSSRNSIREKIARLSTLMTEDNVTQKEVNALINEIGELRTSIMKERIGMHAKIKALLTDEQKTVFNQKIARRGMGGRGDCMGPRGGYGGRGRFN